MSARYILVTFLVFLVSSTIAEHISEDRVTGVTSEDSTSEDRVIKFLIPLNSNRQGSNVSDIGNDNGVNRIYFIFGNRIFCTTNQAKDKENLNI